MDGMPVELDGLRGSGRSATGCSATCSPAAPPDVTLAKEWRRGVLPPGRLGWRLAKRRARRRPNRSPTWPTPCARADAAEALDVAVDLGDGRLLTGTVTDVYGDRVVRASYSRVGPKHWIDAWVPLLALCASRPTRSFSAGSVGRGAKGRRGEPDDATARVVWGTVPEAHALLRRPGRDVRRGHARAVAAPAQDRVTSGA